MLYRDISSKRYEPPLIDLKNKNDSQTLLIQLTGENKKVLEVGTSTGYVSKILKEQGNIVTGIEIDSEAGTIASQYCESMIIGDIEKLDLDSYLVPSSFDVIMFGDVLEHLIFPDNVLIKVKKYLKPNGYIVVSLPNICHGDIILNLLQDNFEYAQKGLLDYTHLRFFGLKNIIELFSDCGYRISDLTRVVLPIGCTEQKVNLDIIPGVLINFLQSLPDASVYQYVIKASISSNAELFEVNLPDLKELFLKSFGGNEKINTCCYIDTGEGFSEEQKIFEVVNTNSFDNRFNLFFDLYEYCEIKSLRWDPVEDYIYSIKLDKIKIKMRNGELLY